MVTKALVVTMLLFSQYVPVLAQVQQAPPSALKKLSLEELLDIDVTSVSKRNERASKAAAAVEVITAEDIRRSGAVTLRDALRLAVGLDVAEAKNGSWAVSARGFNATAADKLLVLIDGRAVYSPLFSGVFWDAQDYLLPDIDRIEIIRGPGATLWGANAVNGVINVITKGAGNTQGGLVALSSGNELLGAGGVRFGGMAGGQTAYRAYSKYYYQDALETAAGSSGRDPLRAGQAGFRADWDEPGKRQSLTFQGDIYHGLSGNPATPDTDFSGGNLLGRWSRTLRNDSSVRLQLAYDRIHRNVPASFGEERNTFDVDFQHELPAGSRHTVLWGAGYRVTADRTATGRAIDFDPIRRTSPLYSAFVQDDVSFLNKRLLATAGVRLEHNDFTGLETEPSVRLAWQPREDQTVWGSIARAVRMPTRLDSDILATSGPVTILGNKDFKSEALVAYEAGYRTRIRPRFALDVATFYNVYDNLRSQEPQAPQNTTIILANKLNAKTYGAEVIADFQVFSRWRLRAGYDYLHRRFQFDPDSRDPTGGSAEGNDPENRFLVRSYFDLPGNLEFDTNIRFVGLRPSPQVPRYAELDAHLGWFHGENLELSVIGRNLFRKQHPEFGAPGPAREEIRRSVYGGITWRF